MLSSRSHPFSFRSSNSHLPISLPPVRAEAQCRRPESKLNATVGSSSSPICSGFGGGLIFFPCCGFIFISDLHRRFVLGLVVVWFFFFLSWVHPHRRSVLGLVVVWFFFFLAVGSSSSPICSGFGGGLIFDFFFLAVGCGCHRGCCWWSGGGGRCGWRKGFCGGCF